MSIITRSGLSALLLVFASCVPKAGYVAVDYAPANYAGYPQASYEGSTAYYIDGLWYTRRPQGWIYYTAEPPPLRRYRLEVLQPRVRYGARHHGDVYVAPPVHRQRHYQAPSVHHRHRYSAPRARHDRDDHVYRAPPARHERR